MFRITHSSLICLCLCLLLGLNASAQNFFSYGIKGGISLGTPIGPAPKSETLKASGTPGIGPNLGIFARYDFKKKWGFQAEFYYTQKKGKFITPLVDQQYTYEQEIVLPDTTVVAYVETVFNGKATGKFDNRYLEMPILGFYQFSDRFSLTFGPYISYLLRGGNSGVADGNVGFGDLPVVEDFDESEEIAKWDYGVATGVRYETKRGVNYQLLITTGLTSIYKDSYVLTEDLIRNLYLQLTAGYRFRSHKHEKS